MGHITAKQKYEELTERLNRFPQGAPPSETLYKILGILFNEREAELVSKLPLKHFTVKKAAKRWKLSVEESKVILDELASRAILLDINSNGESHYVLPPPMAGFIEFSMMRIREDIDQHSLGQLLHQYMNVEDDFVRALFYGTETKMVRAFVNEKTLQAKDLLEILDYESVTTLIQEAKHIGVSMCYCRHKMLHMEKNCDAPMDICMTFNNTADSLIQNEYARRIDKEECLKLLETAYKHNLVQIGENIQDGPAFICNCCGCCCEALLAAKKFGTTQAIATSNYLPVISQNLCKECGKCLDVCPVDALTWVQKDSEGKYLELELDMCLGCGVCVRNCQFQAINMEKRGKRILTPVNTMHRVVLTAIDKGCLANLIFDNNALASHRMLAALVQVILSLPPAKQLLANEQIRSKYLARLCKKEKAPQPQ